MVRIDRIDKKILMVLGTNARLSQQQIARLCTTSRDVVQYRMQKLEKLGVIKAYVAHTQNRIFGVQNYVFLVRLQNFTAARESAIVGRIKKLDYVKLLDTCRGDFDLLVLVGGRNNLHLASLHEQISNACGLTMRDLQLQIEVRVLKPDQYQYLLSDFSPPAQSRRRGKAVDVDSTDIKIIRALSNDARMPISALAKYAKLGAEQTSKRLRALLASGAITNMQAVVDVSKLGFERYVVFLKLSRYRRNTEVSLRELCSQSPFVSFAQRSLGAFDVRINMAVHSHNEFLEGFDSIRAHLGKYLQTYAIGRIVNEAKRTVFVGKAS